MNLRRIVAVHDLKPGSHRVKVQLAANDHTPLGVEQTLDVQITGTGK